jgi:hypothetical protein
MNRVGFEPTIPVFERLKTVRTLDRAAIGTGISVYIEFKLIFHSCNSQALKHFKAYVTALHT